jgi:hypothetical protein
MVCHFFNFAGYLHCIKSSAGLPPHHLPVYQISEQFLPTNPWVKEGTLNIP